MGNVNDIVSNLAVEIAGDAAGRGSLVARAAADIRSLVLRRSLLPGEQVRQEDLSAMVGVSRGPIREALQILAVEGVVRYERNRGYFVTRFTAEEMRQLYLIRDLLESEMLSGMAAVPPETIETMRAINERIRHGNDDLQTVIGLNGQFHDLIFANSDLHILRAELQHIRRMTTAYQSLSINTLTNWELLASDHDDIIDALARQDNARLVELCRTHRDRSLTRLSPLLG
jgi:DNA-binding GntR family transcriptional regulator